jgi:hypothetical protein
MNRLNRSPQAYLFLAGLSLTILAGCALETRPTLDEVRTGRVRGQVTEDATLQPGEIRADVTAIDPARREIRVQTDDGRKRVLLYDRNLTRVTYHGWNYTVDQLEAGDLIAFRTRPRDGDEVETIRIQDPVQARRGIGPGIAGRSASPARADVVEGTVERVQVDLGVFDVQPRTGRVITVSVPYNAKASDVESFRRLRRGDFVRVEGEFVNPDSLQLLSFLSPRDR